MQAPDFDWQETEDDARINFPKIIHKIKINWIYCLLCGGLLISVAYLYLYVTNPVYNSVATVLIKDNNNQMASQKGGGISTLQDLGLIPSSSNVNNELQIITSYPLILKVVEDLQLYLQFSTDKNFRKLPLYKNTLPFKTAINDFNSDNLVEDELKYDIYLNVDGGYKVICKDEQWIGKWNKPLKLPFGQFTLYENSLSSTWNSAQAINLVVSNISSVSDVYQKAIQTEISDKQSSIISLSLATLIPQQGNDILNKLLNVYQIADVEDNKHITDSTIHFINSRLVLVGHELDSIETEIQTFKQNNNLADLTAQSQSLISNSGITEQNFANQRVQLSVIKSLIEYMDANKDNPRVVPTSLAISNGGVSDLINKYNSLLLQKQRLLLSATDDNPVVLNLNEQLTSLKDDIVLGLYSIKHSLEAGLAEIEGNAHGIENLIRQIPAKERTFVEYSRQQSIKQELYLYLLQKREESLISKSSTISNVRIIAPGRTEARPLSPNKKIILAGSWILGLLLPFIIATLKTLANVKIRTKEDIETGTKVPILAEILHNDVVKSGIVVSPKSRDLLVEQFRILRTDLNFLLNKEDEKVILFTSSMPNEGKSFVSLNLSAMIAYSGKKVIILELDLRRPKLSRGLLGRNERGFSDYAIGKAEIDDIIFPVENHPGLFIMPSGAIPPNPAELILLDRTREMFSKLREKFDYIIIDTTPYIVADAHLLGKYSDVTLYLVRVGYTYKDQLKQIEKLFFEMKLPRMNLLINDVNNKRSSNYYGYGNYGYGYGYETYFDKKNFGRHKRWWRFRRNKI